MRSASRFWRDPGTRDLLVAGALTVYGQVEAWTFSSLDGPRAAVAAITAATTAVTVFRRRAPIAVAVAVIALVLIGGAAWNVPDQLVSPSLALLLACYSVGAHAPLRAAVAGLAAVLVPLFVASLAAGPWQRLSVPGHDLRGRMGGRVRGAQPPRAGRPARPSRRRARERARSPTRR